MCDLATFDVRVVLTQRHSHGANFAVGGNASRANSAKFFGSIAFGRVGWSF